MSNSMKPDRRGASLLETMVVVSVSSTLMLIAVGWIHQSFKLSSGLRDRQRQHQSLLRLGRDLRDDAHRAIAVEKNENEEVRFRVEDAETEKGIVILYRRDAGGFVRLTQRVADNEVLSQERYHLDRGALVRWDTSGLPDRIGLAVLRTRPDSAADEEAAEPRIADFNIDASIGRWRMKSMEPLP